MSIIAKLLGFTGLPQWGLELIAIGLVSGAIGGGLHHIYSNGKKAELAIVTAAAAKDHQAQVAKATTAEHTHDTELAELQHFRDTHPEQPVRLCLSPAVRPAAGSSVAGVASGRPSAGSVQPVPAGNSGGGAGGVGPDIGGMLEALAGAADRVSAERRELKARL